MEYDAEDISSVWLAARTQMSKLGDLITTPGRNTFDIMQASYSLHALSMQMVVLATRDYEVQRRKESAA